MNDVRTKMNEEIANIKNVLKSVEGEMNVKEEVLKEQRGMKMESESLMEEIRYVLLYLSCVYVSFVECVCFSWEFEGGGTLSAFRFCAYDMSVFVRKEIVGWRGYFIQQSTVYYIIYT